MTSGKTRLGLLALFLVATIGSAQTMAVLMDEEKAEIRFAGNAAGNTAVGVADTDWGTGAGNQPASSALPSESPAEPDEADRWVAGPPPDTAAVAMPQETAAPAAPDVATGNGATGAAPGSSPTQAPVLAVDSPPPVPPPA